MIPEQYKAFKERFAEVMDVYDKLGDKIHQYGSLDEKTRRLIKLAYAIAIGSEGGTHAQVRKALASGISKDEIYHTLLLGLQAIGFAKTVAGFTWINDILREK